jgi:branched-chain amino acid transport system permease protein
MHMLDFFDVFLVQQLLNGLAQGLVYALIAIGFTLIFGVLNVVNFAHGEIYMLGAFAGLLAIQVLAPPGFAVLLLVAAAGLVLGVLLERVAFRPFRRFNDEASLKSKALREATLLSSLAISIITRELMQLYVGADMQSIPQAYLLMTPIQLGPLSIASGQVLIFVTALLMFVLLQWLLFRTRLGLSIRAVSNNRLGALHVGINVNHIIIATFAIGSLMGAVSGIVVGLYSGNIFPQMGFSPGIKAFVAMVMGGLDSIPGAVISAIVLGLCEVLSTDFVSQGWSELISYGLLLITLLYFPRGLFGKKVERV